MTTVRGQDRATVTSASVAAVDHPAGDGVGVQARERRADRDVGAAPDVGGDRGRNPLDPDRAGRQDRAHPDQPEDPREDGDDREPPGRQQPRAAAYGGRARGEARAGRGEPDGGAEVRAAAAPVAVAAGPPGRRCGRLRQVRSTVRGIARSSRAAGSGRRGPATGAPRAGAAPPARPG